MSDKTKPNCFSNGMKKLTAFILTALVVFPAVLFAAEKKITLTTYYPAPYGEYKTVKLVPQASEPVACTATQLGALYTDATLNSLQFCNGTEWITVGEASVASEITLGGYSRASYLWDSSLIGGNTATGYQNINNGWTLNAGNWKYPATLYSTYGFRTNRRLLPAGTLQMYLVATVDIDQRANQKDTIVKLMVERVGSTNLIYTDNMTDDNDTGVNHAPATNPLPAGDCVAGDNCTTFHIEMTAEWMTGSTANTDAFFQYRLLVYRQRNDTTVRLRDVTVTQKRIES